MSADRPFQMSAGEWEDLKETARLILMERPGVSMAQFTVELRALHSSRLALVTGVQLYEDFVGFGERKPTLSVETGNPLNLRKH